MNANELADEVANSIAKAIDLRFEASTMLRTIPELEAEIVKDETKINELGELINTLIKNFYDYKKEWELKDKQQQAEIEALKTDSKRLDWIWANRDYFVLRGIELFTEATQHFKNVYGIRPMIDEAMDIARKAQEK